jgi:HemK-like putative methylase
MAHVSDASDFAETDGPAQGTSPGAPPGQPTPPRTPYEEAILGIWTDVLGRSGIGVDDDFFVHGDHSLAPAVVARIRKALGVDIPVMDFLECRTAAALAAMVADRSLAARSGGARVVRPRRPDAQPVLSFDQQRLWMEHQLLPGVIYNVHGRRRLLGPLDAAILDASIRAIISRHETLRTRFPTVAGLPVQVVDEPSDEWHIRVEDLRDAPGDRELRARRLLDAEGGTPFDLTTGPLLRCLLIRLNDAEHLLGVTMHHIVSDAWSIGLFVRELSALYLADGDAARADLPPLAVQYRDYAVWQRDRLVGETLDRQVAHWRNHLVGAPPILALPTAQRRSTSQGAEADRVQAALSLQETAALHDLCRAHGVTPFMALLAGLATVLGRWAGQDDVAIGVPLAGRSYGATDHLIGFFVNVLPFRVKLSGNPTFAGLLDRVRRVALDGYANADAPLDVLVEDLQVNRDPRRTPLFEVVLNVVGSPEAEEVAGLAVEPLETPSLFSRFDLSVTAQEEGGALQLKLDLAADRSEAAMVRVLVGHLRGLLLDAVKDPTRHILDYRLQDPAEQARAIVAAANAGPRDWAVERFGFGARDRFAVLTSAPGYLVSARSSALDAGAEVVVPEEMVAWDPGVLTSWLRDNAVTAVYLQAPALRALAAQVPVPRFPALRQVFLANAGDLIPHDIEAARTLAPNGRIAALYRVGADGRPSAVYEVPVNWEFRRAPLRVPLGTELPHTRAAVVTPSGESAAVGELGEIWLGGCATGDLGRRWSDGSLEYVRPAAGSPVFDPLETLATLRDVPDARDAVIREGQVDGRTALVGYLTGPDPQLGTVAIHSYLRARLPGYLIPEQLFILDRLPRTARGGYDLSALPEFDPDAAPLDIYVAPRTPMEEQLAAILTELLAIDRIGVYDSFFELGGFSLLATQLTTRIKAAFSVDLALRDIFESPTIDELAQLIVRTQGEMSDTDDLEALLAELEFDDEELTAGAEPASSPAGPGEHGTGAGGSSVLLEDAMAWLGEAAAFSPDKPDETPQTTAWALWCAVSGTPRPVTMVADHPIAPLSDDQRQEFSDLVRRRVAGEPLAYLTGRVGFLGLEFLAEPGALIPRRETELLGGAVVELARALADSGAPPRILDLGTGAGNLAVSLASLEPRSAVWASDLEAGAVGVARRNAAFRGVADKVTFGCGDLFAALDDMPTAPSRFDIVVCNPPYMPTQKARGLPAEVGGHEPTAAFDGGDVGLSVLYRLIDEAPGHLVPGGWLCFELGAGMGRVVERHLAMRGAYGDVRMITDQDGITRSIIARMLT